MKKKVSKGDKEYWFYFPITFGGVGTTPEEAWSDALDSFMQDPGSYDTFKKGNEVK